jgi:GNAT superfamily N-acetyltransferase
MIQQIPQQQLMDYWPHYDNHKRRNILAQNLAWGRVKGFVDNFENPAVILFLCQQWACYLTGNRKAENLKEFLVKIPENAYIFVPSQEWEKNLKIHWPHLKDIPLTDLSANNLSLQNILRLLNSLPDGFQLKRVDVEVAKQIVTQNFSDHWVSIINNFGGPEKFVEEGVGFCIQEGEKLISLVMGYKASIPITRSIELDIATHTDYRKRGFATVIGAKMIEYCLEREIEPHWDAANPYSVKLALKLGFTDPVSYKCYYWRNNP